MENTRPLESIPDDELLRRLGELLRQSRRLEHELVAHIAEVDSRKLYAREASSSMFAYCTDVLHLSEAEAYLRIAAARASREHPILLNMLADGRLHLTGIGKLAPYITEGNRDALLARATHRSKRQIEELIADLFPCTDAPAVMRKLPEPRVLATPAAVCRLSGLELRPDAVEATATPATPPAASRVAAAEVRPDAVEAPAPAPVAPAVVQPLAPGRYKVQFTARAALHDKLERLRDLMRSQVRDGDLAAIIEVAVTEKLERLEARRFAKTKTAGKELPEAEIATSSRYIPAAIRRAVSERDEHRCRYVDGQGRRCPERGRLEYHHRYPYGLGGDRSLRNICLMCRTHNAYLAEQDYGRDAMIRHQRSGKSLRGLAVRYTDG
jgi:hypothetical protein